MKNYIIKFFLLILIFLFIESCRTREDQEKLGLVKKKKETFTEWQWSVIRCIIKENPPKELCTDEYWMKEKVSLGFVELNDSNVKICGGLSSGIGAIYRQDGTEINENNISQVIPLKCKYTNYKNWYDDRFAWYKLDSNSPRKANHVLTHSIIRDFNGNPIDVDLFSDYKLGDTLFCCRGFQKRDDCNRFYEYVTCVKLSVL